MNLCMPWFRVEIVAYLLAGSWVKMLLFSCSFPLAIIGENEHQGTYSTSVRVIINLARVGLQILYVTNG